ncbi:interleukin-15 receptor subunit alpha isoform X4 [Lissotriton helveticus]
MCHLHSPSHPPPWETAQPLTPSGCYRRGAAPPSSLVNVSSPTTECHVPEQVQHTQPFPREVFPSKGGTSLRYQCEAGYRRKAGTSNLIVCKADEGGGTARWTTPEVECIRDPSLPPPPATFTTKRTTPSSAPEPQSTTYQDFGTHRTAEADIMSSEIPTTRILTSSTPTASPESTSDLRVLERSSATTLTPESSSTGTATPEETTLTHDTSAVGDFSDQFWNKHTQIESSRGPEPRTLPFQ